MRGEQSKQLLDRLASAELKLADATRHATREQRPQLGDSFSTSFTAGSGSRERGGGGGGGDIYQEGAQSKGVGGGGGAETGAGAAKVEMEREMERARQRAAAVADTLALSLSAGAGVRHVMEQPLQVCSLPSTPSLLPTRHTAQPTPELLDPNPSPPPKKPNPKPEPETVKCEGAAATGARHDCG